MRASRGCRYEARLILNTNTSHIDQFQCSENDIEIRIRKPQSLFFPLGCPTIPVCLKCGMFSAKTDIILGKLGQLVIPVLPLTFCVNLGQLLDISGPHCFCVYLSIIKVIKMNFLQKFLRPVINYRQNWLQISPSVYLGSFPKLFCDFSHLSFPLFNLHLLCDML